MEGTPDSSGGCTFPPVTTSGAAGSPSVESAEVSISLSNCTETYESGYPQPSVQAQASQIPSGTTSRTQSAHDVGAATQTGIASTASYSASAHVNTWYNDPLSIKLTQVHVWTQWNVSGGCVSSADNSYYDFWAADGWDDLSHTWDHGINGCSYSYSTDYEQMGNPLFCPGWTYTTYNPNRIRGDNDYGYWSSYNDTPSGTCAALLSWEGNVGFGT
jgi:hypothetical protein